MRFGLFYEHQIAQPWAQDADEVLLRDALDQVELADRLGFDYVWEVEHHFLEEYSHSSAPEVFLAAASQRTRRIRLGHGIVQLPPAINHPARVAERAASLDLISGGRLDLGTGEGSSQVELGGFGVDPSVKRAQWEECLDIVTRMMVERPFAGWDGPSIFMPPRDVVPHPKQKPHPPLWVACSRRDTLLMAAEKGIGALSFSFVEPEQAREWVEAYYRIIASEACRPAGFAVNPNVAVVVPMMCHADEATAIERGIDGAHFFGYALSHYYTFGKHRPGHTSIWDEFLANRDRLGFARHLVRPDAAPLGIRLMEQGLGSLRGAVGTPAQIRALIRRYEAAGVDQVIFLCQTGHTRHEHICESLELFGREVLPDFAAEADARDAARLSRLAPAIERALARKTPPRQADPTYVVTPTGEPADARTRARRARLDRAGAQAVGARIGRAAAEGLVHLVRRRSDAELTRLFSSTFAQRALFTAFARAYIPGSSRGWTGSLAWTLRAGAGGRDWVMEIDGRRAQVRPGTTPAPAVHFETDVATFLRLLTGEVHPAPLVLDGRLQVRGDLGMAARMADLFEGQRLT